jgi:hypothetical protein
MMKLSDQLNSVIASTRPPPVFHPVTQVSLHRRIEDILSSIARIIAARKAETPARSPRFHPNVKSSTPNSMPNLRPRLSDTDPTKGPNAPATDRKVKARVSDDRSTPSARKHCQKG